MICSPFGKVLSLSFSPLFYLNALFFIRRAYLIFHLWSNVSSSLPTFLTYVYFVCYYRLLLCLLWHSRRETKVTQAVPTTVAGTDGHATPPRRWEQLPDGQSTIKQCHTRSYSHPSREDIARLAVTKRSWTLLITLPSTTFSLRAQFH